jgi:hypothetical protein
MTYISLLVTLLSLYRKEFRIKFDLSGCQSDMTIFEFIDIITIMLNTSSKIYGLSIIKSLSRNQDETLYY